MLALVERNGRVRAHTVADVTAKTLKAEIFKHVEKSSRILTDEYRSYEGIGPHFDGGHETVAHGSGEYVRGDVHSNTVEGFFSILKRRVHGIYHNISRRHLHRYLAEFSFRYTHRDLEDGERLALAIKKSRGNA